MAIFRNRRDAGRKLAEKLSRYANRSDVIVLALPRGGVPVAYEVALALNAPLDIFTVRKLGVPGHEELAMGAIATGGARVINQDIIRIFNIPQGLVEAVVKQELKELERRERAYRGDRAMREIHDHTAILIDDGLATGASMHSAIMGLRAKDPAAIVVAVPTAAPETCEALKQEVDDIVCATTPEPFYGVSRWYEDFSQTTDEEVQMLLEDAARQVQQDSMNDEITK
ncbi:MAG TPA: phosphoribosyltransferase [Anaerolineales bacterium]|nr:phosphoribosyltransferase [Anaerolineales bacterium]